MGGVSALIGKAKVRGIRPDGGVSDLIHRDDEPTSDFKVYDSLSEGLGFHIFVLSLYVGLCKYTKKISIPKFFLRKLLKKYDLV